MNAIRGVWERMPGWGRWLVAATVLRAVFAAVVPLSPEEAYHWTFARNLDWSYLDHPPMIAWAIAAGCAIFGDTIVGVRFVPLLFGTAAWFAVARLTSKLHGPRAASFAVLLSAIQPSAFAIGAAGFPDSPLLLFWTLTILFVVEALRSGRGAWWLAAGAALGAAMLSKYTAIFLPAGILVHLLFSRRDRRWLASPWPYAAVAAAIVVFSPVLLWNAAHDWASLRFQSVDRFGQLDPFSLQRGSKSFAQQWLGIVPLTLPLVVVAAAHGLRSRREETRLLVWTFLPASLFFLGIGFMLSTHVLWALPAYVGATVVIAGRLDEGATALARFYARRALWLGGLSAAMLLACAVHLALFLPGLSPVRSLYGWREAAVAARRVRDDLPHGAAYVGAGRKYTVASQLAFHLRAPHLVHGKNVIGGDGLQFAWWSDGSDLAHGDVVVVASDHYAESPQADREFEERLRRYFRHVHRHSDLEIPVGRATVLPSPPVRFVFYVARGYGAEDGSGQAMLKGEGP